MVALEAGERRLRDLAAAQHGYVTTAQARATGLSRAQVDRLVRSSRWERVTDRVVRLAGAPPTGGEWAMVAVLDVGLGAVLSHAAAARWWGLPGFGRASAAVVTTGHTRRRTRFAEVHQVRRLPAEWSTVLQGVPVVRPELMVMQVCATEHPARAERCLDHAWSSRLLSGPSVERFLDDYGARGRNGCGVLRELLAARGPAYVPPASNLEARAIKVLDPLPVRWRRQVDTGGSQWTGRVDLRAEGLPLIVEIQSERYHSALVDARADRARIEALEAAGFVVVELTDVEVWSLPEVARRKVADALTRARHLA